MSYFSFTIQTLVIILIITKISFGQEINPNGYNKFTFPEGSISSEGYMKEGKPVGYWKSYYPNGILKSEGARKNEQPDSIWKFYDQAGRLTEIIDYKNGVRSGYNKKFSSSNDSLNPRHVLVSKELYVNNERNGKSYYYDEKGLLEKTIEFEKNYKNGYEKHYDTLGNVIYIIKYSFNNITDSEKINRFDTNGKKQGIWKTFYPNDKLYIYANYKNDTLNGYYREYNTFGEITKSEFYVMGQIKEMTNSDEESENLVVKKDYYADGIIKSSGTYSDTLPIGLHRFFDTKGNILNSKQYDEKGILSGEGITDKEGKKQGKWKFFYDDGKIKSEGNFVHDKREGKWLYYFNSGMTEQIGNYKNGKPHGQWIWYYENQKLRRTGEFDNGYEKGFYYELSEEGDTLSRGSYLVGFKTGEWMYHVNDYKEIGNYVSGKKEGLWKHYYDDGTIQYEGQYVEDFPDGKHKTYFPDGSIKLIAFYSAGNKENKWKEYDKEGNLVVITEYKGGKKYRINGQIIKEK
jgi:antitoxin component YwqK of YwqJK toxin-antitoxin module